MLFLFFLMREASLNNVIFILDESVKGSDKINNFIRVKKSKNKLELIFNTLIYYVKFKLLCYRLKFNKNNTVVFGADHITGAKFFLKRFKFILFEDGTINYSQNAYRRSLKNKLFSIPVYGMHDNVSKIYLTQSENIPDCIKDKVEIINLDEIWNKKDNKEKEYILDILGVDTGCISILKNKPYILYTQPLSEDGVISEIEKIELYKNILLNYDSNKVVIKPHPREKTDYQHFLNGVFVFRENIPSELLPLLGIKFEKAITLFSTAVLQHDRNNIVFYGTNVHPKIYQHFGNVKL
ncbi:TPA: glycosyltransferase family 52 [Mannheimia haemolytica]